MALDLTREKGMEGIIAKRKNSVYRTGMRTSDWLKIKARLQQEFAFDLLHIIKIMTYGLSSCWLHFEQTHDRHEKERYEQAGK